MLPVTARLPSHSARNGLLHSMLLAVRLDVWQVDIVFPNRQAAVLREVSAEER